MSPQSRFGSRLVRRWTRRVHALSQRRRLMLLYLYHAGAHNNQVCLNVWRSISMKSSIASRNSWVLSESLCQLASTLSSPPICWYPATTETADYYRRANRQAAKCDATGVSVSSPTRDFHYLPGFLAFVIEAESKITVQLAMPSNSFGGRRKLWSLQGPALVSLTFIRMRTY
jgi:deoxyinosine 3'endonuclease (endonuclease V)